MPNECDSSRGLFFLPIENINLPKYESTEYEFCHILSSKQILISKFKDLNELEPLVPLNEIAKLCHSFLVNIKFVSMLLPLSEIINFSFSLRYKPME